MAPKIIGLLKKNKRKYNQGPVQRIIRTNGDGPLFPLSRRTKKTRILIPAVRG